MEGAHDYAFHLISSVDQLKRNIDLSCLFRGLFQCCALGCQANMCSDAVLIFLNSLDDFVLFGRLNSSQKTIDYSLHLILEIPPPYLYIITLITLRWQGKPRLESPGERERERERAVSYTHLTLPTRR